MAPGGAPIDTKTQKNLVPYDDNSTTTLSTIAVRAGVNASIVIALLKSGDYIELRVDEMRPKLLSIGSNIDEARDLLKIHEDLMNRLADKEAQVDDVLNRTDQLSGEKKEPKEAVVYDEMAKSLRHTWKTLNRQLILRGYLLRETVHFYEMAYKHQQLTSQVMQSVRHYSSSNESHIESSLSDIIDVTAEIVDIGSSVMTQIRTLGQVDDNPERPHEVLQSCVQIENIMLKVASDWETCEREWQERGTRQQSFEQQNVTTTTEDELVVIEQWLTHSEKRVKALNESGQKQVLTDGNKHLARLREISQSSSVDGRKLSHLSGRIEEFLHYLKTRMNRSQRIKSFIQNAKSILSQLNMMASDMLNANSALVGELAPLAKQKAQPLIAEGKDIAEKEVLTYEEQRNVKQLTADLAQKLKDIEELAKNREASGETSNKLESLKTWLNGPATSFLAQKGDMGGSLNEAREFTAHHKQFATEILNRDMSLMGLLSQKDKMTPNEEREINDFVKSYEKIKDIVENRIQIGKTYEQVHTFGKDLESSFNALQTLLENNRDYTNEKVALQISNVFQMIQETLAQEKHQGDKFVSNAEQIGKFDEWLNIKRAQEAVQNMITDHENRLKYLKLKWEEWKSDKTTLTQVEKVIEEIQMWQQDVLEFISSVDNKTTMTNQEAEESMRRIEEIKQASGGKYSRLQEIKGISQSEEQQSRISVLLDKHDYIQNRLNQLHNKVEINKLLKVVEDVQIWQEEMIEIIRNVNQRVSTDINNQQYEEIRKQVDNMKSIIDEKSRYLDSCRSLSDVNVYQEQLKKTIHNQEQIRNTVVELQDKLTLQKLIRVVEEIQMWQEEAIEIIRFIDKKQINNVNEAKQNIECVHDLQEKLEKKSLDIQEVKKMSTMPEFVKKMNEVEHVQEQIKFLTMELEDKLIQEKLTKVTEEVQMWQEEMIEIIRLFDTTPIKTVQACDELQAKVELIKEAIQIQQPKIEEVVKKATDEKLKTSIAQVIDRQQHIKEMATKLERKSIDARIELSKPEEKIQQTSKTVELETMEQAELTLAPQEQKQLQVLKKIVEEIQMWQEEVIEIIRILEQTQPKTIEESEKVLKKVDEVTENVAIQSRRIEEASEFKKDKHFTKTVEETKNKQDQVRQLVKELYERAEAQNHIIRNEAKRIEAPRIVTQLQDAQVDEGARHEFTARIESQTEPVISWLKDGIDVKNNQDYRQEYINSVASLVIEESFIEDTATYTVRATNEGGSSESSASLIVKSRSALSSTIMDEEKPRFVRQMQNVQVNEGETASIDCVVVGKPEPEVTWYKEENAVKESERIHLTFAGDHCQMIIDKTVPLDNGVYTVRAKNEHGEVAQFCQLRVTPKKQPPKTAPKPQTPKLQRPPSIQPPLTNTTWQEGETATLKVMSMGEPKPKVTWLFNDAPVQQTQETVVREQEDGWSTLTINQISPKNAGMYTAIAQNEVGEAITGATVHVQPSITQSVTTEQFLQEDMVENVGYPVEKTVITKSMSEYQDRNFDRPAEMKRWVDVVEQHFEDHLSQHSISPIPKTVETKRIEREQRWVDSIDAIWSPVPEVTETKKTVTTSGTEHLSSHTVHEQSPMPTIHRSTTDQVAKIAHVGESHESVQPQVLHRSDVTRKMMNAATVRQSPAPETHKTTITRRSPSVENVAKIRQSPAPETHRSNITRESPSVENVAMIRQSPAPETHKSTITRRSPSVENVAKIRQSPAPETHRTTITRRSPSVENAAKIRQSPAPETHKTSLTRRSPSVENIALHQPPTQGPESHKATTTQSQPVGNIAKSHKPVHQDKFTTSTEKPTIDRIDDILSTPLEKNVIKTVTKTVTRTGDIDKQVQERERQAKTTVTQTNSGEGWVHQQYENFEHPEQSSVTVTKLNIEEDEQQKTMRQNGSMIPVRQPEKTTTVTETKSSQGWVKDVHEDFVNPELSTVTVKKLDVDESEEQFASRQKQMAQQQDQTVKKTTEESVINQSQMSSKIPVKKEPKVSTTVTETVSGEGWVQDVHQDMKNPEASKVTVKRLNIDEQEEINKRQYNQVPQVEHIIECKREETEENQKRTNESKIPIKQEPRTVCTETVSGEGWIQDVHTDFTQPHTSTVVTKKLGIDEHQSRQESRPVSMEFRQQQEDDVSVRQRDSFIGASDVEGFWTDGAYTASPTPPPTMMLSNKTTAEDYMQRIGLSRTTTVPEFLKAFQREYTVEEGGRIVIECILVGNPKPSTRFYFNNRLVTEKTEFLKICHVNDTYSIIISPAQMDHAGYYKMIAENKRGVTETLTVLHVRPRNLPKPKSTEHQTVEEEFAVFEYEQRRPTVEMRKRIENEKSAHSQEYQQNNFIQNEAQEKQKQLIHKRDEEHLEQYDIQGQKTVGHPPHFTQTLVSTVVADGESVKFEGIVTGWPAPTVEWTVNEKPLESKNARVSNIGGRVSLYFDKCTLADAGKYMCTAKNSSGVATSSAQLVVRPKTIAPDFIQRLISEEVEEGQQLKWTIRVTGDPMPKVTWLRDGYEIPNCDEVRIVDEGNGYHSLIIVSVEAADSGQFTCLAENLAGEARSTADLVVRPTGTAPGNYFHVTKVTQEKQAQGTQPKTTASAFSIENPKQSEML